MRGAPVWVQLLCVWGAAVALASLLLLLDGWFIRPVRFYWLIPYPAPGVRGWLALLWTGLRNRPLTVSALLLVPTLATLLTLGILAVRLARWAAGTPVRG